MGIFATDEDPHAAHRIGTGNDTDLEAGVVELRTLLNMELEVTVDTAPDWRRTAIVDAVELVAEAPGLPVAPIIDPLDARAAGEGE